MDAYLDQIERLNPLVNAIVALEDRESLIRQAGERDADLARGVTVGALHGFPQAVKDLDPVAGLRFAQGSPIFADTVATADSIMVERMRRSGALFIGKTNTPEFGLGSQTFNPGLWHDAQRLRPVPHRGRLQRRRRGGAGAADAGGRGRQRPCGFAAQSGRLQQRLRAAHQLRPGPASEQRRLHAESQRPRRDGALARRYRADAVGDRRLRSARAALARRGPGGVRAAAGARLRRRPRRLARRLRRPSALRAGRARPRPHGARGPVGHRLPGRGRLSGFRYGEALGGTGWCCAPG